MRRGAWRTAPIVRNVIPQVQVRQWVLTFPRRVRFLAARHPALVSRLLAISLAPFSPGCGGSPGAGLELVDALVKEPALASYHLLPTIRGDLLAKLGREAQAAARSRRGMWGRFRGTPSPLAGAVCTNLAVVYSDHENQLVVCADDSEAAQRVAAAWRAGEAR